MALLELKEVRKDFSHTTILQNVTLTIDEGDIYGIIGESGSGKTTLLNILTGFMEPTEGEVLFLSRITHEPRNLHEHLPRIKKHIGFTPQHNSYYPKLTVKENLLHFGRLYGLKDELLINNIKTLLQFTGLFEHRNKLAEHLSGGMQKRLDVSCSLAHKPKILVLDEPTADLDPVLQNEILLLLQEVNKQGVTIILASHHLDSIESICNKVAIIHKGHLHSHGLIDEVKKPFLKDYFTINLHPGDSKEKIIQILKTLPLKKIVDQGSKLIIYPADIDTTIKSLLAYIKEENLYIHDLDLRKPSLAEIFELITAKT